MIRLRRVVRNELLRRQVERDRQVRQFELVLPGGELAERGFDGPLAGGVNQSAAFEDAEEARRRQQAEARVLPAQQRFEANQAPLLTSMRGW